MSLPTGLPAFYILVAQYERKVVMKWSDCNQKVEQSSSTSREVLHSNHKLIH